MPHQYQRIGLHVSAAGGVENAPENAKAYGAECFQFFSRSPRGGKPAALTAEKLKLFHSRCEASAFESYIHTPYYINFASANNKIYFGSIAVVREELERASQLGVAYVMTHLGSAKDHTGDSISSEVPKTAIQQAIAGLKKIFAEKADFSARLLLEISAGAGAVLGDSFEELAALLKGLGRSDVHVCLDTCHMFASGYDLQTKAALHKTMQEFKKHLSSSQIKLVHANDSMMELGGRRDRHEHIGKGFIGQAGFQAMFEHPDFKKVNFILETKHDALIKKDIELLKRLRDSKTK